VEAEEEHHPEQAERRNAGHRHPVRLAAHRVSPIFIADARVAVDPAPSSDCTEPECV
jgi:hypothetical protein